MGLFLPLEKILPRLARARRQGKVIVTTNGCFDLLHPGHVACLAKARAQGDVLVVGINSDASVRRLKGRGRTVFAEKDRARLVAALGSVDFTFIFREPDPRRFLSRIRPQVHVKSGDYAPPLLEQETVEQGGGRVYIAPLLRGYSTTAILRKIQSLDLP